jgi:hypothetical protein
MGSTNRGDQKISVDYLENLTSEIANYNTFDITPEGIYSGLEVQKISNILVRITTGVMIIKDRDKDLAIKAELKSNITDQAISQSNPYIIARLIWLNVEITMSIF